MRITFALILFLLFSAMPAAAQDIDGDTTLDIDPSSNTVTATCETYLDTAGEGAYAAIVSCTVTDDNGNVIATGNYNDQGENNGYAEVTLTFTGTPGTTYIATGSHSGMPLLNYGEYYGGDQPINLLWFDDPFNFLSFTEAPQTYDNNNDWEGPGPDEQVKDRPLHVGNTTDKGATIPTVIVTFTGSKSSGDALDSYRMVRAVTHSDRCNVRITSGTTSRAKLPLRTHQTGQSAKA